MDTDLAKENFKKAYVKAMGNVTNACEMVNISRQTYYRWAKEDTDFANDCHQLLRDSLGGFVEGKLFQRINGMEIVEIIEQYDKSGKKKGFTKIVKQLPPSEKLIQFWLETKGAYTKTTNVDLTSGGEKIGVYIMPDGTEITF